MTDAERFANLERLVGLLEIISSTQASSIKVMSAMLLDHKTHIAQLYAIIQQAGIIQTVGEDEEEVSDVGTLPGNDDDSVDDFQNFVDGLPSGE